MEVDDARDHEAAFGIEDGRGRRGREPVAQRGDPASGEAEIRAPVDPLSGVEDAPAAQDQVELRRRAPPPEAGGVPLATRGPPRIMVTEA
jgi:hypothetical protein